MKNRKQMPEPSVFYRRRKGKIRIELPSESVPSPVRMERKGSDRGGGEKRGRR